MSAIVWLEAAVLLLLLAGSFFFAMAETALVSANRLQIRRLAGDGDPRAVLLERILQTPERFVTTILVGNNIVNIVAASLATILAIQAYGSRGAIGAPIVMTIIVLVAGEITPKTLAVKRATPIALSVARAVSMMENILRPVSIVLSGAAVLVLRIFGVRSSAKTPFITQEEIEMLVREGVKEGEVERFEQRVISEVFEFTETPVREVMTDREKVHHLSKDATLQQALEVVGRSGHSRVPVTDGDFDHVLGFVHAKDLLLFSDAQLHELPVTQVLRSVLHARAEARSDHVLARMQRERKLMAIIQDDTGRNVGIATVEDLLEELVGEIHDEFDRIERPRKGAAGAP